MRISPLNVHRACRSPTVTALEEPSPEPSLGTSARVVISIPPPTPVRRIASRTSSCCT